MWEKGEFGWTAAWFPAFIYLSIYSEFGLHGATAYSHRKLAFWWKRDDYVTNSRYEVLKSYTTYSALNLRLSFLKKIVYKSIIIRFLYKMMRVNFWIWVIWLHLLLLNVLVLASKYKSLQHCKEWFLSHLLIFFNWVLNSLVIWL